MINMIMRRFPAKEVQYKILCCNACSERVYPYIKDEGGDKSLICVSPVHGRSFVVSHDGSQRWIVSKGNGLSYSNHSFLDVSEFDNYVWGALTAECATRDFHIGIEVNKLGIKTNMMQYVIELDCQLVDKDKVIKPCLLQYEVECPYRLCDFPFIPHDEQKRIYSYWENFDTTVKERYLVAANILVKNLFILHTNNVMHNALHVQNFTWKLELLDFESSRTDNFPYENHGYEENVLMLMNGEIMKTYEIINYIAWCFGEIVDYAKVDGVFYDYGFDLKKYRVLYE